MKRAYFCWVPALGADPAAGEGGIYHTESASKARYLALLNARDAGYDRLGFHHIKVRREPAFDGARHRDGVMPKYINREAAA